MDRLSSIFKRISQILVAARSAESWSSKPPIGASGDISGLSRPPWPAAVLN